MLQARAAWVRAQRETFWLVGLRDERGEAQWGCAVSVSRSRALPMARILRVPRFGHGLTLPLVDAACATLRDLARAERVLRLHVELYLPDAELRASVFEALTRSGFGRSARPRSYARTVLIDLRPTEEELFASFHRTCRQNIRGLSKHSLECLAIAAPSLAGRMNALVAEAMARTGGRHVALDWPAWIAFIAGHPDLARLVGVFRKETSGPDSLVGYVLGCRHGDTVEYSVAASTRLAGTRTPLLYAPTWRLIQWAKSVGATTFDFGGITAGSARAGDPVGGISDFKRSFSGNVVEVGGEFVLEPSRWRSAAAAVLPSVAAAARRLAGR